MYTHNMCVCDVEMRGECVEYCAKWAFWGVAYIVAMLGRCDDVCLPRHDDDGAEHIEVVLFAVNGERERRNEMRRAKVYNFNSKYLMLMATARALWPSRRIDGIYSEVERLWWDGMKLHDGYDLARMDAQASRGQSNCVPESYAKIAHRLCEARLW